jgi:hypothetical protein
MDTTIRAGAPLHQRTMEDKRIGPARVGTVDAR